MTTTTTGAWISRTLLLLVGAGLGIFGMNMMQSTPSPTLTTPPQKTSSEVTGTLSTIDMNTYPEETPISTPSTETGRIIQEVYPWDSLTRGIWVGDMGEDIKNIQDFLIRAAYLTGEVTGTYDKKTALALNQYIKDKTGDDFTRLEIGIIKLKSLKSIGANGSVHRDIGDSLSGSEITGTLTTEQTPGITVDSIESLDGRATATLKDGKITVQVINPDATIQNSNTGATPTEGWRIHSSIARAKSAGGLQGVVISAPYALPTPGTHTNYQSIILTADGSSGIFFTIDGSEPSCDGKGMTDVVTDRESFTLKAISCFGGNRVRGPIASYTYILGK